MKYGIRCVEDSGVPGAINEARWTNRGEHGPRLEFDSDAAARAYIRDLLLPKKNLAAEIKLLRDNGTTTRTAPAAHWVFYAWPLPAEEPPT